MGRIQTLVRVVLGFAIIAICVLIQCSTVKGCVRRREYDDSVGPYTGFRGGILVTYKAQEQDRLCRCNGLEKWAPAIEQRKFTLFCNLSKIGIKTTEHKSLGLGVTCAYIGNPLGCSKYNQNGQETFYQEALNDVGSRFCSLLADGIELCPRGQIITQICGDMEDKNLKYERGP